MYRSTLVGTVTYMFIGKKKDSWELNCRVDTSSKRYQLWIKYDIDHIIAYYCKCRAGARTVGTCSHVAAVIWYLGTAVHTEDTAFGVQDWGMFLEDAAALPETTDSSDSEESAVEE